jgi:hypothetical protein
MRRASGAVVARWLRGFPIAKNGTSAKSAELQLGFHTTTEQITTESILEIVSATAVCGEQVEQFRLRAEWFLRPMAPTEPSLVRSTRC